MYTEQVSFKFPSFSMNFAISEVPKFGNVNLLLKSWILYRFIFTELAARSFPCRNIALYVQITKDHLTIQTGADKTVHMASDQYYCVDCSINTTIQKNTNTSEMT